MSSCGAHLGEHCVTFTVLPVFVIKSITEVEPMFRVKHL